MCFWFQKREKSHQQCCCDASQRAITAMIAGPGPHCGAARGKTHQCVAVNNTKIPFYFYFFLQHTLIYPSRGTWRGRARRGTKKRGRNHLKVCQNFPFQSFELKGVCVCFSAKLPLTANNVHDHHLNAPKISPRACFKKGNKPG